MSTSADTLLRLIRAAPELETQTPRVLSVDDWAKKKGHSYGSILVDLEKHKVVDLLPDRTAESLANWLVEHPGVEVIKRDGKPPQSHSGPDKASIDKQTKTPQIALARHQRRKRRYQAVRKLYGQGVTKAKIARQLKIDPRTIRKYVESDRCPTYSKRPPRRSKLDSYKEFIQKQWADGLTATQILKEIRQLGYKGGRSIFMNWVQKTLRSTGNRPTKSLASQLTNKREQTAKDNPTPTPDTQTPVAPVGST